MAWQSYKDLIVWQKAIELCKEIYRLTEKLPTEEKFSLTNQMRRAAVSVPSNIAEGHGRKSEKEFSSFLGYANGSCFELETQLIICTELNYLQTEETEKAIDLIKNVSKMLIALMQKL